MSRKLNQTEVDALNFNGVIEAFPKDIAYGTYQVISFVTKQGETNPIGSYKTPAGEDIEFLVLRCAPIADADGQPLSRAMKRNAKKITYVINARNNTEYFADLKEMLSEEGATPKSVLEQLNNPEEYLELQVTRCTIPPHYLSVKKMVDGKPTFVQTTRDDGSSFGAVTEIEVVRFSTSDGKISEPRTLTQKIISELKTISKRGMWADKEADDIIADAELKLNSNDTGADTEALEALRQGFETGETNP